MSKSIVTVSALNLRQGPGTAYKIVGHLQRNDQVDVLGSNPDGSWKNVRTAAGLSGWCSGSYMTALNDTPASDAGTGTGVHYRVVPASLYLRAGPGTNFTVMASLPRNEVLESVESAATSGWLHVRRTNGSSGWCAGQFLAKMSAPPVPPSPADSGGPAYRVNVYALNLRSGPSSNYAILRYLHQGDLVTYLAYVPQGRWMQVREADGQTGWCAAQFLTKVTAAGSGPEPDPGDLDRTGLQRVLVDGLELHSGPAVTEAAVSNLGFEDVVDVLEISADQQWKRIAPALGPSGWCTAALLASLPAFAQPQANEEFPWIATAFGELRQRELPGSANNPRILTYINSTSLATHIPYQLPDETDWCAAFVNWCIEQSGISTPKAATVNPWMLWGQALQNPQRGCLVTFQWADGGQHVAFYLGESGDRVFTLGGNQSQAVWIKSYLTMFVSAYRMPPAAPTHAG